MNKNDTTNSSTVLARRSFLVASAGTAAWLAMGGFFEAAQAVLSSTVDSWTVEAFFPRCFRGNHTHPAPYAFKKYIELKEVLCPVPGIHLRSYAAFGCI